MGALPLVVNLAYFITRVFILCSTNAPADDARTCRHRLLPHMTIKQEVELYQLLVGPCQSCIRHR